MNFADAWAALNLGARVAVSDSRPRPAMSTGLMFFAWRSHNFTGTLIEKIEGDYRGLKIEMDPAGAATIAYTVSEAVEHRFTEA